MPRLAEPRGGPVEVQIRANVERFQQMLRNGNFLRSQRDTIGELLVEEEAKLVAVTRHRNEDR